MKIEIVNTNGRWLVNGKTFCNLSLQERRFMDDFFREVKLEKAEI